MDFIEYEHKTRIPADRLMTWLSGDYTNNLLYNKAFHSLAICGVGCVIGLDTIYKIEAEFACPYKEYELPQVRFATYNGVLYMAHVSQGPWKFFRHKPSWDMKQLEATINLKPFRFHTSEEKDVLNGEENSGQHESRYEFIGRQDA